MKVKPGEYVIVVNNIGEDHLRKDEPYQVRSVIYNNYLEEFFYELKDFPKKEYYESRFLCREEISRLAKDPEMSEIFGWEEGWVLNDGKVKIPENAIKLEFQGFGVAFRKPLPIYKRFDKVHTIDTVSNFYQNGVVLSSHSFLNTIEYRVLSRDCKYVNTIDVRDLQPGWV